MLSVLCQASCVAPVLVPLAHAGAALLAGFHATAMASFHVSGVVHAVGAAHAAAHATAAIGAGHAAGGAVHVAGAATAVGIVDQVVAGAAATGAATSAIAVGPKALTDSMRHPSKPASAQAVGRILQIEWDRLCAVAGQGSHNPLLVFRRVQEKVHERKPIIAWALNLWLRESLELIPFYRQVHIPDIWGSIRALELELASQIKFGLTTSPLRVIRLAYSTLMVVIYALLGNIKGFRQRLGHQWPKLVDHLAATLETNLREDPSRVLKSGRNKRLGAKFRRWFPMRPGVL